ncbi:MAG: hypothetical protein ACWGSD_16020 [Thermodesulfobacteriota bacterium]
MTKVRTFTSQLKIFHMMQEIEDLDEQVNDFIASNRIRNVISTSDAITTGGDGETVGIIRVLTYEEP